MDLISRHLLQRLQLQRSNNDRALSITDTAIVLMLGHAISNAGLARDELLDAIRYKPPIIFIDLPFVDYEERLVTMIESGLVLPGEWFAADTASVFHGELEFSQEASPARRFVAIHSYMISRFSDKSLEKRVTNLLEAEFPVLILCDGDGPVELSPGLIFSSDLNLKSGPVDERFLCDLLEVTHGSVQSEMIAALRHNPFDPGMITLVDLALAIRPGRTVTHCIEILKNICVSRHKAQLEKPPARGDGKDADSNRGFIGQRKQKLQSSGSQILYPESTAFFAAPRDAIAARRPLQVEHLVGYGAAQQWALDLKADLEDWRDDRIGWRDMSTKLLLSGPPGTGKTTFARALCNTMQLPVLVTSVATWLEPSNLGDVLVRMQKVFDEAQELKPCILFIDEIDGIGKRSNSDKHYSDYWNSLVNKALELLDGAIRSDGVVIVGATNRPEVLDEALTRAGRLEKHIALEKPDIDALAGIFAHHLSSDLQTILSSQDLTHVPTPAGQGT
ncbi:ATP-binding protein [Phyllobacterium sp. LjRoot231]|uniref:ATP-binding protein n=1 Tax=Phyllobacterium sp. LjRoot231 TaxID=3342289 RepID=UPI003ECEBBDA